MNLQIVFTANNGIFLNVQSLRTSNQLHRESDRKTGKWNQKTLLVDRFVTFHQQNLDVIWSGFDDPLS